MNYSSLVEKLQDLGYAGIDGQWMEKLKSFSSACTSCNRYNLYSNVDGYLWEIFIPGVIKEDIEISVRGKNVYVNAKKQNIDNEGYEIYHKGYEHGYEGEMYFEDCDLGEGKLKSSLKNGVLRINVPFNKKFKVDID